MTVVGTATDSFHTHILSLSFTAVLDLLSGHFLFVDTGCVDSSQLKENYSHMGRGRGGRVFNTMNSKSRAIFFVCIRNNLNGVSRVEVVS